MYVKWFDTVMVYYVKLISKKMTVSKNVYICRRSGPHTSQCSQGLEHRSQMPASAGGDGQGSCRGHIVGAKNKVSAAGTL
ncbi:unnamed protein product [Staurois parvus]|uniref:Uncharacterized protein n=1 Tax=Staurois parvus TaxID=386267 RepID=A0ABN9B2Y0_9NEOB|nr:unnamed protein product [Staurois parvus]